MATIDLDIISEGTVRLDVLGSDSREWGADEYVPMVSTTYPDYEGEYRVTPRLAPQTLATTDRVMRADVEVEGIPSYRTTNVGGGYTVVIAQD